MKSNTEKKLTKVFRNSLELPYNKNSKFILMSDVHRSSGNYSDTFADNKNIYLKALDHYFDKGFTYIEVGDGDELWDNKDLTVIVKSHIDAFKMLMKYHEQNRLYLMYGNHDICKKDKKLLIKKYCEFYDCDSDKHIALLKKLKAYEGIVLKNDKKNNKIFIVHGHQGSFLNDTFWRASRFLVRYFWRYLEMIGIKDPTSVAKNYRIRTRVEKKISNWSKENNQMVIAGHTHRARFPKIGETMYFNDGAVVLPRCITAIEIENEKISLVKWRIKTRKDGTLYIGKEIMEGPIHLDSFFNSEE